MDPHLIKGTLDMLILDVVARGKSYGYHIAQTVLSESNELVELKEGSLYPALHRLERQKLLKSSWTEADSGRRRKYYAITPTGRRRLKDKKDQWSQFSKAVDQVLGASHAIMG